MGAQNGKESMNFENISENDAVKMQEKFSKNGAVKGKINQRQFETAFPSLSPISDEFFHGISCRETDKKVHLSALLKNCDAALGTYSDLSQVLVDILGENYMDCVIKVYAKSNGIKTEEADKLKEYFEHNNRFGVDRMDKFMMEYPVFAKMSQFMFSSILSHPSPSLIPFLSSAKSSLLTRSDMLILNSQLPIDQQKVWTLLFSSSTMGCSFSQMVKRINKEGPCLVVIQSEARRIFGFYASAGFHSGPLYHGNDQCFLFETLPHIRTYASTGRENSYAYLNFQQQQLPNGLGIAGHGDTWPLFLHEEYGSGICQKDSSAFEKCFVAGEKQFKIKNLEVWRVGEKPVLRDEDGEIIASKKEKSIIDKDPEARAVLEMAGKPMHSEAYREPAPLLDDDDDA